MEVDRCGYVGWGILTRVVHRGGVRTLLGVEIFVHATRPDHAARAKIQRLAAAQDTGDGQAALELVATKAARLRYHCKDRGGWGTRLVERWQGGGLTYVGSNGSRLSTSGKHLHHAVLAIVSGSTAPRQGVQDEHVVLLLGTGIAQSIGSSGR